LYTHIVIRWLTESKKLSKEQLRAIQGAQLRQEIVALSAISLLETAALASDGRLKLKMSLTEFLDALQTDPLFRVVPLTFEVANEAALPGSLRDPADRAIVATARVHRLRLVTSDQRITESKLVPVVA
jgi:PIN domain nuclease of toxin-antitoxin system